MAPNPEATDHCRVEGTSSLRGVGSRRLCKAVAVILVGLAAAGCGSAAELDPTPEKLDGSSSYEFERDDLDAAEEASDAVKDYCAEAASEAQRLGCESHVTDEDIP